MSAQERDSSDEIQQLRNELQLVIEERQASMIHDMLEMMAELMRNNGPSDSSSAEGNAAVTASPRAAEPTAVKGNGAEDSAAERGSQQGTDPTAAARQKICCWCCYCWRRSARIYNSSKRDDFSPGCLA